MRRTPQYLSPFEFMLQRERVDDDDEWNQFWNQIVSSRVFIVEDWDSNIGNVENLHYDYGIKGFFKGEVDASFHDGKNGEPGEATISVVIWRDKEVICSEVYMDVQCTSIHVAEAYAVLALFFKCFELKIEELVLWTDNSDIHGSVTGSYTVSQGRDEEERDLLLLLGCMMKRFKKLVAMLKPRELMFLADDIARGDALDLTSALKKFDYQLRQKALFRLSLAGPANLIVKKFKKTPYIRKHQTTFFLLVDNLDKLDAIAQIRDTLCPSELYLAIHCLDQKPDDFQSRVKECFGSKLHQGIMKDGCTVLHHATKFDGGKRLLVVVDSSLPKERYDFLGCFTIILVSWVERKALDPSIEELSALSYRYFCGADA